MPSLYSICLLDFNYVNKVRESVIVILLSVVSTVISMNDPLAEMSANHINLSTLAKLLMREYSK
jgi:hypothetical protein